MVWRSRGSSADNAANRRQEAHVEHAIGFIEHQYLDLAKVDQLAAKIIFQAPGVATITSRSVADRLNLALARWRRP